jgi:hypothetical protein
LKYSITEWITALYGVQHREEEYTVASWGGVVPHHEEEYSSLESSTAPLGSVRYPEEKYSIQKERVHCVQEHNV